MPRSTAPPSLDDTVHAVRGQLRERGVPRPQALLLMATGASLFAERLGDGFEIELETIDGVPPPFDVETLHAGLLGGVSVWLLTDVSGEPSARTGEPPQPAWARGFPVWLAAASGADLCVHTSAGSVLAPPDGGAPVVSVGGFALASDHLNHSGETPLRGLGESRLGPLFPDISQLHHLGLRRAALERAETLGLAAAEAVVACTAGPTLETPAERRMLARLGADVAVQSLAVPLLAAGHAGLSVLAIVAVVAGGEPARDVAHLVARAAQAEPALTDLLLALAGDLERAVSAQCEAGP